MTTATIGNNFITHVAQLRSQVLMLPAERHQEILAEVRDRHAVRAEDLSARFGVSVETVRRDLRLLAERGLLERVYGGAALSSVSPMEGTFDQRIERFAIQKIGIAKLAASLLRDGDTILIDVGTTCHEFAKAIPPTWNGRVVTNAVRSAVELAERPGVEVLLAGGWLRGGDLVCSGRYSAQAFDDFFYSMAFVGSGAVHASAGLTDYQPGEAELRRNWLARVGQAYVLADSSKLGEIAPCRVSPIDLFTAVITDDSAESEILESFAHEGITVLIAPTDLEDRQVFTS